jgi:hypothetical protein
MERRSRLACCALIAVRFVGCSSGTDGASSSGGGTTGAGGGGGTATISASGAAGVAGSGVPGTGGATAAAPVDGGGTGDPQPGLAALGTLPACSGTVTDLFSKAAIQPPATGSGIYDAADPARRAALDQSIRALVGGDVPRALSAAQAAAYDVCRTDDGGSLVVVLRPHVTGQGHAVVAWRAEGAKPLIVEAPHAFHDVDTELEATEMFLALGARALVVSGIYRCASLAAGPCDGYTTACTGVPSPYTISDAAHNSDMLFQAAHVALAESFAQDFVTSLHGMPDPGISVSNGTQMSPAAGSFQVRLFGELTAAFPAEQITACQDISGSVANKRWCGSENVQGRHVNGAPDVCAANATVTSNRFVHVEQSRAVRTQRAQVIAAFGNALK